MKIVFRVDASVWSGSGHVMRCLVLADELKKLGYVVFFACLPLKGNMISYIEERGFDVILLTESLSSTTPTYDTDYASWLQRSALEDASDFISSIHHADLVITDHYAIDKEWQKLVRKQMSCHIVAIDDLVRVHDADFIIDQTLGRDGIEYSGRSQVLAGCSYALLAPNFLKLRNKALKRNPPKEKVRVLVSMGGVDNPNATLSVLQALVGKVEASFTVLLGSNSPHYQEVKEWCTKHDNIKHKDFERDMAELMLLHDIAIGAPGTTSWERACLGLPSILVPLADNQSTICTQLLIHQAIIKVDLPEIGEMLLAAYKKLICQWTYYYHQNLKLCDGLGARRVALEIEQLLSPTKRLSLRLCRATQGDIERIYHWQCHPKTREFALNSQIPSWQDHKYWMIAKLNSIQDYFYIIVDKKSNDKQGVVRLDCMVSGEYLVSIYIAPDCYGKGIAIAALQLVDKLHPDMTIHATVLKDNLASHKLFQKANYTRVDLENYIRYAISERTS